MLAGEGQYAWYHKICDGHYHQYPQPAWPVAKFGYLHPDQNREYYVRYRDEEENGPPAGLVGYFAHKVNIGDRDPGQPCICCIGFLGYDLQAERHPDIYCNPEHYPQAGEPA